MVCRVGNDLLVVGSGNRYKLIINNECKVIMTGHEMAKFVYILKYTLDGEFIGKKQKPILLISGDYKLGNNIYQVSIWADRNPSTISITINYSKIFSLLFLKEDGSFNNNSDPTLTLLALPEDVNNLIYTYNHQYDDEEEDESI